MSNIIIPSVPADRQEIFQLVKSASDSLTRIAAEREHMKSIIDDIVEKYELPSKHVRKMIKIYHAGTLDKVSQETDDLVELYTAIIGE